VPYIFKRFYCPIQADIYIYDLANNPTGIDDNWLLQNKINNASIIVISATPPIVPNPNR